MIRKAVLLIHGFAGGNYDFGNLNNDIQIYSDIDVFTFTLPGHDKLIVSNVTKEDWINRSEEQLKNIINNNYDEIYIIGHSMGGVIATYLASKYKEVTKLILAAPAFEFFKFKDNKISLKNAINSFPLFHNYKLKEILSRILRMPIRTVKEFSNLINKYGKNIKNVTCPTLIIYGKDDKIVPYTAIEYVYNNISSKSITLYTIKDVNHNIFTGKRYEEIKNIIINFLKDKKYSNLKIKKDLND